MSKNEIESTKNAIIVVLAIIAIIVLAMSVGKYVSKRQIESSVNQSKRVGSSTTQSNSTKSIVRGQYYTCSETGQVVDELGACPEGNTIIVHEGAWPKVTSPTSSDCYQAMLRESFRSESDSRNAERLASMAISCEEAKALEFVHERLNYLDVSLRRKDAILHQVRLCEDRIKYNLRCEPFQTTRRAHRPPPIVHVPAPPSKYKYKGPSGTMYQYDLNNLHDRNLYRFDLNAQQRDSVNLNPGISIDRTLNRSGGGAGQ